MVATPASPPQSRQHYYINIPAQMEGWGWGGSQVGRQAGKETRGTRHKGRDGSGPEVPGPEQLLQDTEWWPPVV